MEEKLKIHKVNTLTRALKMLDLGRMDYLIATKYSIMIKARKLGMMDRIEILPNPIIKNAHHLGFSKKSSFRKYLPEVNKKINYMQHDATLKKMFEKYIKKG